MFSACNQHARFQLFRYICRADIIMICDGLHIWRHCFRFVDYSLHVLRDCLQDRMTVVVTAFCLSIGHCGVFSIPAVLIVSRFHSVLKVKVC